MPQTTVLKITHAKPASTYELDRPTTRDVYWAARQFGKPLDYLSKGLEHGSVVATIGGTEAAFASGTLTLSSASGTVGGVINGVTVTVAASGGDAATATAIAAAINASTNALVKGMVTASAASAVVTVRAFQPGKLGNATTLAASGTGVTASGARLTGGAGDDVAPVTYVY